MAATPTTSRTCTPVSRTILAACPEWQAFFADLKDDPEQIRKSAAGASWKQANWPVQANGELVSALDGNWGAVEKAVGDKLKGKAKAAGQPLDAGMANRRRAIRSAPS
jgi:2-oxoglutarate dehydrogenase E1 component